MPIYEYRCPEGHLFERFQSMTAPAPERCDVCEAAPVELVLYPVAIHYKGSGFYSTDYGKGKAAKTKESGGGESGSGGSSGSSDSSGSGDSSSSSSTSTSSSGSSDKKPSSGDS